MSGLDEAKDIATTDVGPLPLWGWAIALVGGIAVARRMSRGLGGGASSGGSGGAPATQATTTPTAPTQTTPAYKPPPTNTGWLTTATNSAVASGASGLAVSQALGRYLQGDPVAPTDAGIVETAINNHGLPPDPPYIAPPSDPIPATAPPAAPTPIYIPPPAATPTYTPPTPTPAPTSTPTPAPAAAPYLGGATAIYTVRPGDTLSGIGARYGIPWRSIFDLSRAHAAEYPSAIGPNPDLIRPGEKVLIP